MSQRTTCTVFVWKVLLILTLVNDPTIFGGPHHHASTALAFSPNLQHSNTITPTSCTTTTFPNLRQNHPCGRHNSNNHRNQAAVPIRVQALLLAHHGVYEDAPLSSLLSDASMQQEPMTLLSDPLPGFGAVPIIVLVAVGLFIAAQTSINQQLQGDQGLGAFLKDGRGFKGSAFRPVSKSPFFKDDSERAVSGSGNDPLPWLPLPQLDFVEVAGQKERLQQQQKQQQQEDAVAKEKQVVEQLEQLRLQMNEQLQKGNIAEAMALRNKLEQIMKNSGIEFQNE
jgi:hypothetical protein